MAAKVLEEIELLEVRVSAGFCEPKNGVKNHGGLTPRKINMEHNHGGLEDHFPF